MLDKNNLTKEDVCNGEECDYNNINKKILYNFHLLCKRLLKDKINILSFVDELLEKNNDIIIISNEIGYGIVPLDKEERTSSNFMDKRLDNLDENDKKKLIFKTPVECDVFYFSYAKAVGFGLCWSD